jgi:hypothetical protein
LASASSATTHASCSFAASSSRKAHAVGAKGILASGDNRGDLAGRVKDVGYASVV